jgi:hypothetical protein
MVYDYTAELQAHYDAELASFRPHQPDPPAEPDLTTSKPGGPTAQQRADMHRAAAVTYAQGGGDMATYYAAFDPHNLPVQYWNDADFHAYFGHDRGR